MVPRPRINSERAHRHVVTLATSTAGLQFSPKLAIYSDANGTPSFYNPGVTGGPSSPNLSMSFSLDEMQIFIGGTLANTVLVPNSPELQVLYDTYQIEKVDVAVYFGNTESLASGDSQLGAQWIMPLIGYAPDTDDAGNTSITQLQQYSTYKVHQTVAPLRCSIVPCARGAVQGSALSSTASGYTRLQRQDIDIASPSAPHFGLKMCVDNLRANPNGINTLVSIQARMHFLMKATR